MAPDLPGGVTPEHIRQSNLIENIDDPAADATHMQAWQYLAAVDVLSLESIFACHRLITADALGADAGRLRQVNVQVGGRVCPPWEAVSGLLGEWLSTMHRWSDHDPRGAACCVRTHPPVP